MSDPNPEKIVIKVYKSNDPDSVVRSKDISVSTDEEVARCLPYGRAPYERIRRYLHNAKFWSIHVVYSDGRERHWIPNNQ